MLVNHAAAATSAIAVSAIPFVPAAIPCHEAESLFNSRLMWSSAAFSS